MHTASWCRCWVETWVPACRSSSQMLHFCMALASFQPKIGHRQNWKRLTPSFYLWHWLAEIKSGQKVPKCQGSKIMWHEHVLYFRPILCGQSFLAFHELQDQEVDLAITISISPYFLFIDIIYLEPKWPLFWLLHQNRGQTGSRYIYIYIYLVTCFLPIAHTFDDRQLRQRNSGVEEKMIGILWWWATLRKWFPGTFVIPFGASCYSSGFNTTCMKIPLLLKLMSCHQHFVIWFYVGECARPTISDSCKLGCLRVCVCVWGRLAYLIIILSRNCVHFLLQFSGPKFYCVL